MKNNLTQSQSIRIGIWAVVLVITSIANMLTYNSIMAHFNVPEVIFFYIIVAAQFISLIEIYLITLEKSKRKRRSKR
jgi:type IV secretory pathway TrbL component